MPESDTIDVPGIVRSQFRGLLNYRREMHASLENCVREGAIADRLCTTWEDTITRFSQSAFAYGAVVSSIQEAKLDDLLTEEELAFRPEPARKGA